MEDTTGTIIYDGQEYGKPEEVRGGGGGGGKTKNSTRWKSMTSPEILQTLKIGEKYNNMAHHRYCNEAYYPERDKGRSMYRESDKIGYWRKVLNCVCRYKMDFFFCGEEIKVFLPSVLDREVYPFVLSKPELVLRGLVEEGDVMRHSDILQSKNIYVADGGGGNISGETERGEEGIKNYTNMNSNNNCNFNAKTNGWTEWLLSLVNIKKQEPLHIKDALVSINMLKELWIDFQKWLSTEMSAKDNLIAGPQCSSSEYVLKHDTVFKYLRDTLGLHVCSEHVLVFVWYITNCLKTAMPFSVDVSGWGEKPTAIKIHTAASNKPIQVSKLDECAVVDRYAVQLLQSQMDSISTRLQECRKKALELKKQGNIKAALIYYKHVKLSAQKLDQACGQMMQLETAWASRDQAKVMSTVQAALQLNVQITRQSLDGEKILKTLDEVQDVNEAIDQINESFKDHAEQILSPQMNSELESEFARLQEELTEEEVQIVSSVASPPCHPLPAITTKNTTSTEERDAQKELKVAEKIHEGGRGSNLGRRDVINNCAIKTPVKMTAVPSYTNSSFSSSSSNRGPCGTSNKNSKLSSNEQNSDNIVANKLLSSSSSSSFSSLPSDGGISHQNTLKFDQINCNNPRSNNNFHSSSISSTSSSVVSPSPPPPSNSYPSFFSSSPPPPPLPRLQDSIMHTSNSSYNSNNNSSSNNSNVINQMDTSGASKNISSNAHSNKPGIPPPPSFSASHCNNVVDQQYFPSTGKALFSSSIDYSAQNSSSNASSLPSTSSFLSSSKSSDFNTTSAGRNTIRRSPPSSSPNTSRKASMSPLRPPHRQNAREEDRAHNYNSSSNSENYVYRSSSTKDMMNTQTRFSSSSRSSSLSRRCTEGEAVKNNNFNNHNDHKTIQQSSLGYSGRKASSHPLPVQQHMTRRTGGTGRENRTNTGGEGGAVLTRADEIARTLQQLRGK